jgi:hypothetical protein
MAKEEINKIDANLGGTEIYEPLSHALYELPVTSAF